MKRTLIVAAGLALVAACGAASAASWSVVVEPGVYGRVAIGGYVQAPLVYEDAPVVAGSDGDVVEIGDAGQEAAYPEPVYLWVPAYQRIHWADYCDQYGARGVPVYFVQDGWYRDNVMGRRWTPEQRSWSRAQWIEQDRIARERWEDARRDRGPWNGRGDARPSSWQGPHGGQWPTPMPSPWHGDAQRGVPQPSWRNGTGGAPQPWRGGGGHASSPWSGESGRAPQLSAGIPVRGEPGFGHGDGPDRGGWNQGRGGNAAAPGGWQAGSPSSGQPVIGAPQPVRGDRGAGDAPQPAHAGYGGAQPGPWTHGGDRPVQPGALSNQPGGWGGSRQAGSTVQPTPTAYVPGRNPENAGARVGSNPGGRGAPHENADVPERGGNRGDGGGHDESRGAYQHHANEGVDR